MVAPAETAAVRPTPPTHSYSVTCEWSGSTGVGYDRYSRAHVGHAPPAATAVRLSSDPAFRGDPSLLNPEQLVVLAAASCQLLAFLAIAARARVDVRDYQDTGSAVMTEDGRGGGAITEITLRPRITVVTDATEERLRRLAQLAHEQCFIAASLNCPVNVSPTFEILTPYAFRDTDTAARRLALVSDVFDPGSRAFIHDRVRAAGLSDVRLAVDLGCGPGHTTRLLAAATGAARTVGLDASTAFVATAVGTEPVSAQGGGLSADGATELAFLRHDVSRLPFPAQARKADVVYARLLLPHLVDVTDAIGGWITQVAPHGLLLLDEVESIDTDQPALAAYLDHARHLLAARGTTLHAGRLVNTALHDLAAHSPGTSFEVEYNATEPVRPPVPAAAEMFGLNLAVWRDDPLYRDRQPELDRLAADLAALAAGPEHDGHITWTMRRVAVRRLAG
ncbi:OsmC family protein [Pseudofrankia inefficax]|uniref:OsmC family protein n=1 Tax=Pseudofrankia inefficax (strain DSM 45817 / CECT 9037 / DDB 130130 / EuI1c) TaxID=298654 RepID=E3J295_PSEI1|nr:OsmC family protein [Pseudofrankia inefficax]ADP78133.1 OsmC family protein [Pseudofrankia inefficax]